MNTKKGTLILSVIALSTIGILYFGNFTVLNKDEKKSEVHQHQDEGVSFDEFEVAKINGLDDKTDQSTARTLRDLWEETTDKNQKIKIGRDAARFWSERSEELAAYYYYLISDLEKNPEGLIFAGDRLFLLYRESDAIEIKSNLINFAVLSYETALNLQPDDNTLKLKTGEVYLESMTEPMKGVGLLKDVVEEEPENMRALTLLGRFSIISGQYEKAKEYLDKALILNPGNTEAIYFMAFAQEGLGNKDRAIELFELLKKMIDSPEFSKEIDQFIETIKSN